jgi:type III secretory pathway component EscR
VAGIWRPLLRQAAILCQTRITRITGIAKNAIGILSVIPNAQLSGEALTVIVFVGWRRSGARPSFSSRAHG